MLSILSLVTSVKDYVEIAHKLIDTDTTLALKTYSDFGGILTYLVLTGTESLKDFITNFISLKWFQTLWSLPIIIPDISSAMVSEISILDGYFHNAFTFLDTPISYGNQNFIVSSLEKFVIGLINSLFLFLPSSTAHIITLRRFVMQGLEAGFISGLGTIAGNIFWISSIILGWRFFVIPWLSLDIFRYFLGFILLIKYMWDCYNEKKVQLITNTNTFFGISYSQTSLKIFVLNFLLALTEQTCFYPFLTNISISPESSILETFPADNFSSFIFIHLCYIGGLLIGSLSLLHFSCWFWENPAFKIYMWFISSASTNPTLRASTSSYYKIMNFLFLYLTMICAISSIPYYGLDYLITNPLGLISEDRILNSSNDKKQILEFSFLKSKASDKNTRRNRGRHGRRERWKRRVRKYRTFDATLYDQGVYDLFTIEDLNYGFDRFWLRRKMRNHRVRFRFFPGPWMRSFKKQLAKPRLESSTGPRSEFFRILFEQVYHPTFHSIKKPVESKIQRSSDPSTFAGKQNLQLDLLNYLNSNNKESEKLTNLGFNNNSILRKFVRKFEKRIKTNQIGEFTSLNKTLNNGGMTDGRLDKSSQDQLSQKIYSKRWKQLFSIYFSQKSDSLFGSQKNYPTKLLLSTGTTASINPGLTASKIRLPSELNLSKKEKQIYRYKSLFRNSPYKIYKGEAYRQNTIADASKANFLVDNALNSLDKFKIKSQTLLHPIKYYLQKEQAFERKLRYYSPTLFRTFSVENNAPYFRIMMKKYFYHYKPTLRWERTMKVASLRKARRKTSRLPRKFNFTDTTTLLQLSNKNKKTTSSEKIIKTNIISSNNVADSQKTKALTNLNSAKDPNNFSEENFNQAPLSLLRVQKPTHAYSVVSKKATRYRSKIYRDVLQHWYYTPFNRLLLKFDVDSFIKRQPFSHFLTKKEENLLHLKRYLLSEHYDTLRWYTYMQHYRSMKNKIGGSKSFASKTYNQQFMGTFKKIRHLFAITPNQTFKKTTSTVPSAMLAETSKALGNKMAINTNIDMLLVPQEKTILKFDQLLYNESIQALKQKNQKPYLLEELRINSSQPTNTLTANNQITQDVSLARPSIDNIDNSLMQLGNSINPIRKDSIKNFIENKNSLELAQFLYKDTLATNTFKNSKVSLDQPVTNTSISTQNFERNKLPKTRTEIVEFSRTINAMLITSFLKRYKKNLSDQDFLKTFLTRKIDKFEKRKRQKEKHLKSRLTLLENWLATPSSKTSTKITNTNLKAEANVNYSNTVVTGGLQKAFYAGSDASGLVLGVQQTLKNNSNNLINNKNKIKYELLSKMNRTNTPKNLYQKLTVQNLKNFANLTQEKQILISLQTLSKLTDSINSRQASKKNIQAKSIQKIKKQLSNLLSFFKNQLNSLKVIKSKTQNLYKTKFNILAKLKYFLNTKNKATAIRKQKRLRKVFKKMKSKKLRKATMLANNTNSLLNLTSAQKSIKEKTAILEENKDMTVPLQKFNIKQNKNSENTSTSTLSLDLERKKRDYTQSNNWQESKIWSNKKDSNSSALEIDSAANLALNSPTIFKRKRSPGRRANSNFRRSRARGIIKKQAFKEKNFSKKLLQKIASAKKENGAATEFVFKKDNALKIRRSKMKKHRFWRTTKRTNYSQKYREYRKATQDIVGKIRVLSKQKQKIQTKVALQKWWADNFLPNLKANTNILWQIEKDKQIQTKLNELYIEQSSKPNIGSLSSFDRMPLKNISELNQNSLTKELVSGEPNFSASHNQFTKFEKNIMNRVTPSNILPFYAGWDESLRKFVITNRLLSRREAGYNFTNQHISEKSLETQTRLNFFEKAPLKGMNAGTTLYWQIPFTTYDPDQFFALGMDGFSPIGWRRFQFRHTILKNWITSLNYATTNKFKRSNGPSIRALATNGRQISQTSEILANSLAQKKDNKNKKNIFVINKNLVSTTNSSNDNLLSNLNVKETNPRVDTRVSQQNITSNALALGNIKQNNIQINYFVDNMLRNLTQEEKAQKQNEFQNKKNFYRRLKKRYRKVKKHPRPPVWFPSGPLLNQVLPVHYIYVFYKRNRLPKERYLKRRFLKGKSNDKSLTSIFARPLQKNANQVSLAMNFDFTLRRRVKPKRKYHRKPLGQTRGAGVGNITESKKVEPRRFKFFKDKQNPIIYERPYSSTKKYKETIKQSLNTTQKTKKTNVGDNSNMMRVRQLRRRMQRQIFRPVWRYKPRAGGFVWPGDYLKLELIKAPVLNPNTAKKPGNEMTQVKTGTTTKVNNKLKRKKKRTIQEWQVQPKRYLLEKHNLKVLKKKLEKANRSHREIVNL